MTIPRNLSFLAQGASSTGVLGVPNGGTAQSSFTAGYIHFGSFSTSSNLFWDNSNIKLCVGTTTAPSGGAIGISIVNGSGGGLQTGTASGGGGAFTGNPGGGFVFYNYAGAQGSEGYGESFRITSGKNLQFSTAAGGLYFNFGSSSLLNDYEEGTWTPIDSSGASLSFTGVVGTYTKIGRCVTVLAELTYPSTASASSAVIGGLPFTSSSIGAGINGYIRYTTVANTVLNYISGGTSSTTVSLLRPGVNVTNLSMSSATLLFAAIYYV